MNGDLFSQISDWKLEAKLEDVSRYFYETPDLKRIENGQRCYVIGRKGSGKTAMCEYLRRQDRYDRFSEKLSFKSFPFNELYQQKDENHTTIFNQYITIWKYITYISILRMMHRNESMTGNFRRLMDRIFKDEPKSSLARTISYWTSASLSVSIFQQGGSLELGREVAPNTTPIAERVRILEDLIRQNIDASSYYIVFDELDEDFREILSTGRHSQYTALLTGLFKAVQDVKSVFPARDYNIFPVVFLRDDIFTLLKDSDKNKWRDLTVRLEWNTEKIKKLLAHRISRALDPDGPIYDFGKAWQFLFSTNTILQKDTRSKFTIFDYITNLTNVRPRDYIQFIQTCAEYALDQGRLRIGPNIAKEVERPFSLYLRGEVEDELHSIIPEIDKILELITYIGKPLFSYSEFEAVYLQEIQTSHLQERNPKSVLEYLFVFNVIGNVTPYRSQKIFRYQKKSAFFNINQHIYVHPGLHKALLYF